RVMTKVQQLLAARGVTFDSSFVSFPLCCPSRATFLTGQYAHNHGVLSNDPPYGGYYKLDSSNTLAVWLQQAGYHTMLVGKYLNRYGDRNPLEIPPGWNEWYATPGKSDVTYFNFPMNENGKIVHYTLADSDYK